MHDTFDGFNLSQVGNVGHNSVRIQKIGDEESNLQEEYDNPNRGGPDVSGEQLTEDPEENEKHDGASEDDKLNDPQQEAIGTHGEKRQHGIGGWRSLSGAATANPLREGTIAKRTEKSNQRFNLSVLEGFFAGHRLGL